MAIAAISAYSKSPFTFRPPLLLYSRRRPLSSAAAETLAELPPQSYENDVPGDGTVGPEWRMLSAKSLGIRNSMISRATKSVLNELSQKGYDVYLVGGCVRDLIMKKTPKDFDVLTSAELKQVQRTFSRCDIVGRRFPICHVHINETIIEVSSFSTRQRKSSTVPAYFSKRPPDCSEHDYLRWKDSIGRDFTINGLMFNPYKSLIYDYLGGIEDIRKAKVRTVIPARTSFQEDCARILRAIRIAARLGFRFSKETAHSVKDLASLVMRLDKGRLLMEMNYMLAYGSAEASMRLLWKFGLLELLLPIQAAYFVQQGFRRRDTRSNMLLALFSNLDRLLSPDKPCHASLWVGLLAFHEALVRKPQDPMVVATFTLAIHNGGDLSEAVKIAEGISHPHDDSFVELLAPQGWNANKDLLVKEVRDLASSVNAALSSMTDEYYVSQAMKQYPEAPYSDLVFIPLQTYLKACRMFECVANGNRERSFIPKEGSDINYSYLTNGKLSEVRHVFARVVFDTVYPPKVENQACRGPD